MYRISVTVPGRAIFAAELLLSRAASEMLGRPCARLDTRSWSRGLVMAVVLVVAGRASCVEPPPAHRRARRAGRLRARQRRRSLRRPPGVHLSRRLHEQEVRRACRSPTARAAPTATSAPSTITARSASASRTVEPDGTSCTDGDPCTDPDICQQGVCQSGGPLVCDDGNACTIDSCQTGVGCVFSPRDCGLPPDAGRSDAMMTPDAPAIDSGADALVRSRRRDVTVADGPISDAPPIDTGVDAAAPDAARRMRGRRTRRRGRRGAAAARPTRRIGCVRRGGRPGRRRRRICARAGAAVLARSRGRDAAAGLADAGVAWSG